jgi:hypothetical protein
VTGSDVVIPCEARESRPVVTVLVTRLPRRSNQELGRALAPLVDLATNPTPRAVRQAGGPHTTWDSFPRGFKRLWTVSFHGLLP